MIREEESIYGMTARGLQRPGTDFKSVPEDPIVSKVFDWIPACAGMTVRMHLYRAENRPNAQ